MKVEVTSLSSKGQVVIPKDVRERLGISTGAKLVVITDGTNLLLKPILEPRMDLFKKLLKESRKLAKEAGLKRSDIPKIIKQVRRERRS